MSLVRLLPAWLHAVADYAVAIGLIVIAAAVGGSGAAVAAGIVIGAVVLVVSMLTRYPLGVFKVLPFKVHSAGDYLAATLLVASPFALGFTSSDRALTVVYLVAGVAVLGVSLITNYQYGPQRRAASADVDRDRGSQRFSAPTYSPQATPTYATTQPVSSQSWRTEQPASIPVVAVTPLHVELIEQAAARWPAFPAAA
jgi:hypothetical protein